jgi:hypothetical protein
VNYDADCPRCGRRYSTFTAAPDIDISRKYEGKEKQRRKGIRRIPKE